MNCIRGCTRHVLHDDGRREEEPRPAKVGMLCRGCSGRLREWLQAIPDLYATLPIEPRQPGPQVKTRRTGKSHSPALADLQVVALTDPRTKVDHHEDGVATRYIPDAIGGWARMFCEEQELTSNIGTLVEAVRLLIEWHDEVAAELWIDELYTEAQECMALLNSAHGVERPKFRGECIEIRVAEGGEVSTCGKKLYALDHEPIVCRDCGRRYYGLDLVRLAVTREQAESARIG